MNENKPQQGNPNPNKGNEQRFDKDQPANPGQRDRSQADDKGQGSRDKTEGDASIPELDEPDVEGVGNEGRKHTEATTPPGQGQSPKRNTM